MPNTLPLSDEVKCRLTILAIEGRWNPEKDGIGIPRTALIGPTLSNACENPNKKENKEGGICPVGKIKELRCEECEQ